jgi:tetratricopeptide (TPR) repeat protein
MMIAGGCAISPARRDLAVEWYGVGNAWLAAGKWAEAGKAYDRALSLNPALVAASYNAARAFVESGNLDRALEMTDKLLAAEKDNVRFIALRAYALYKAGRVAESVAAYERAYALDQWSADIVYNYALLLLDSGDAAAAVDRLSPLAAAKPDDDGVQALYAKALSGSGREAEAAVIWEDLRSRDKLDVDALEKLGALYEKQGEFSKALDVLASATAKDPKRLTALFSIAKLKLTVADDAAGGLEALGKALDAGFSDREAAAALLALPGLLERGAVAKALADKGLVDDGGSAGAAGGGAGAEGSATSGAGKSAPQN